ncbi:hypothetical protein COW95_01940 [Candidatus Peregrinibacteria bacterium CG22_combo_CG10-13_8_21_14_all_49_11]|nr:MAG: hypothetical protein COW95_01940 [Candidatus Peregrinibacteria bacterium CG22_combo_CG10-13_8_21_14_all_49_11]
MPTVQKGRRSRLRKKGKKGQTQYAEIPMEKPRKLPYGVMTVARACQQYPMISFRIPQNTKLVMVMRYSDSGLTFALPYE